MDRLAVGSRQSSAASCQWSAVSKQQLQTFHSSSLVSDPGPSRCHPQSRSAVLRPSPSGGRNRGWGWLRRAFAGLPLTPGPLRTLTPAPLPSGEGRFEMRFYSGRSACHEDGNPDSPSGRRGTVLRSHHPHHCVATPPGSRRSSRYRHPGSGRDYWPITLIAAAPRPNW